MKKRNFMKSHIFMLLFTVCCLMIDCRNSNDIANLSGGKDSQTIETTEEKIDKLLNSIKPRLAAKSNFLNENLASDDIGMAIINFLVVKNLRTGQIALTNFEQERFFLFVYLESLENVRAQGGGIAVTCTGSKNGDWEEECDGKLSCGRLIVRCLKEGGCSTCPIPEHEELILNKEDFLDIEEEGEDESQDEEDDEEEEFEFEEGDSVLSVKVSYYLPPEESEEERQENN